MAKPTPEMTKFAKEAMRVNALTKAGLSTDADIARLERMAADARRAQTEANERGRS